MADAADKAGDVEELHRKAALANRKPEGPRAIGSCYNCGAAVPNRMARWCDDDCKEDWTKRQRS